MAPRKEKPEKASGEHGAALILDYLRKQNRPYSATDISANLHNKVSKSAAAKFLKEMHEQKEIEGRAFGKQLVYHALQEPVDDITPESLDAMDRSISILREEIPTATAQEKALRSELSALGNVLSTAELRTHITALEAEISLLQRRLAAFQGNNAKLVPEAEKARVDNAWKLWQKHAGSRKKICKEMWERCTELLPDGQTKEELWDFLGLDGEMV